MNTSNQIDKDRKLSYENKTEHQVPRGLQDCCIKRESGKEIIYKQIETLRRRANSLEVILNMLPTVPTEEQDSALFDLGYAISRALDGV